MILPSLMNDFDRAHQTGQPAGSCPVNAAAKAEEHAGTESVAAPCRIDSFTLFYAWNVDALPVREDFRALLAARDLQSRDALCNLRQVQASAIHQQFGFVIIDCDIGGQFNKMH